MALESSLQSTRQEVRERLAALGVKKKTPADEAGAEYESHVIQKHTSAVTSGAAKPERLEVNFIPAQKIRNDHGHTTAWTGHTVLTCSGNFDSNIKSGADYSTISLGEIFNQAEPAHVDKGRAPAIICSTYHAFDGREHEAQRQRGRFVAIPGDIDKGNTAFETVQRLVREFFGEGVAYLIYSTASSTEAAKHWRTLVPLAEPLAFVEWSALCVAFYSFMEANGCQMDWTLARAGQIAYLPNVPQAGRNADGTPKFFMRDAQAGRALLMADGLVRESLHRLAAQREADAVALEQARAEARAARERRQAHRGSVDASVVEAYNAGHIIEELLAANLYEQSPVSDQDWRSPYQSSGSYATRVLEWSTERHGRAGRPWRRVKEWSPLRRCIRHLLPLRPWRRLHRCGQDCGGRSWDEVPGRRDRKRQGLWRHHQHNLRRRCNGLRPGRVHRPRSVRDCWRPWPDAQRDRRLAQAGQKGNGRFSESAT
jgi:hypothetical protein